MHLEDHQSLLYLLFILDLILFETHHLEHVALAAVNFERYFLDAP